MAIQILVSKNGHETREVENRLEVTTNTAGSKTVHKIFSLQAHGQDETYEQSSNPISSGMIGMANAMHEGMQGYEKSSVSEAAVLDALKPGKAWLEGLVRNSFPASSRIGHAVSKGSAWLVFKRFELTQLSRLSSGKQSNRSSRHRHRSNGIGVRWRN